MIEQPAWRRALTWIYPGMHVKRWALLIGISGVVTVIGLVGLIGRGNLRVLYALFEGAPLGAYVALVVGLLGLGIAGVSIGVRGLVRSIIRGVSPEYEGRTSEVIYHRRRLSRGPNVVAIGGGTGLSTLLRGLKHWTSNITAVVTVMDSGGSSGRLREELNMLPPGDIRNCLVSLAEDESQMGQLFGHRFREGSVKGHSLGNLVLAGLHEMTGSFDRSIAELSGLLNIRGRVLPATLENVHLRAHLEDGTRLAGEEHIGECKAHIAQLELSEPDVEPYPEVLQAIRAADVVVFGPGSLYTSILPNLLVDRVAEEIERSRAVKIYVANLMTQPGETEGFSLQDHLDALGAHINVSGIDYAIVNDEPIPEDLRRRYRDDGAEPVELDTPEANAYGLELVKADLLDVVKLDDKPTIKHDAKRLTETIAQVTRRALAERLKRF